MFKEENYQISNSMDKSDKIQENYYNKWPWAQYIAIDMKGIVVAVDYYDKVYYKAVSRGSTCPHILNATILGKNVAELHNKLLEKMIKKN